MFYSIYFSPTGGTKTAADVISKAWDCDKKEIDLSLPLDNGSSFRLGKDDICMVAVPSYGGRVPAVVLERLKRIHADSSKTILLVTYGNRHYDDTLLELKEACVNRGFRVGAAIAAVAEHSVIREVAAGRPDDADRKQLKDYAQKIKKAWEAGDMEQDLLVPGNRPFREYHGIPLKPKARKACNFCGVCAQQCPVQAIPADHPGTTDKNKCISCMRCIKICPANARKVNGLLQKVAGYQLKKKCSDRKQNECIL